MKNFYPQNCTKVSPKQIIKTANVKKRKTGKNQRIHLYLSMPDVNNHQYLDQ